MKRKERCATADARAAAAAARERVRRQGGQIPAAAPSPHPCLFSFPLWPWLWHPSGRRHRFEDEKDISKKNLKKEENKINKNFLEAGPSERWNGRE
jgi:hypothetical protein